MGHFKELLGTLKNVEEINNITWPRRDTTLLRVLKNIGYPTKRIVC